jgi:hypothetical protein
MPHPHWWKQLYGEDNWGVRRCRLCAKRELAMYDSSTFSMFAAWIGYRMDAIEVLTAVIGGIFGFLGGVSLKVLENE